MSGIIQFVGKHEQVFKNFFLILVLPFLIPIFAILVEIVFKFGNCVGSLIRVISSSGMC